MHGGPDVSPGRGDHDLMALDEFVAWVAAQMDWATEDLSEDSDIYADLGMDSVGAVDLMVGIEEAVGDDVIMPIELMLRSAP